MKKLNNLNLYRGGLQGYYAPIFTGNRHYSTRASPTNIEEGSLKNY